MALMLPSKILKSSPEIFCLPVLIVVGAITRAGGMIFRVSCMSWFICSIIITCRGTIFTRNLQIKITISMIFCGKDLNFNIQNRFSN